MSDRYNVVIYDNRDEVFKCGYRSGYGYFEVEDFISSNKDILDAKSYYEKFIDELIDNGYGLKDKHFGWGIIDGIIEIRVGKRDNRSFIWDCKEIKEEK